MGEKHEKRSGFLFASERACAARCDCSWRDGRNDERNHKTYLSRAVAVAQVMGQLIVRLLTITRQGE